MNTANAIRQVCCLIGGVGFSSHHRSNMVSSARVCEISDKGSTIEEDDLLHRSTTKTREGSEIVEEVPKEKEGDVNETIHGPVIPLSDVELLRQYESSRMFLVETDASNAVATRIIPKTSFNVYDLVDVDFRDEHLHG
ncbi:hypothetical protein JHK87_032883 [Glycine soja]|nr:hypothetical protein JHK87_032883 [Glycine soja]